MDEGRDEQDDEKDGRTTPSVAQSAPGTPPCDAPMKVAMLTASGPGVDSDTAMKLKTRPQRASR